MNTKRTWSIVAAAGALLLATAACEDSETVAPDGSTITLAATPSTILLSNGTQAGEVVILATIRDAIGVPLPGQDVRFTTSSGLLTPQAGIPVESDGFGNATTVLTVATAQTTISAQSGKATANIQLQTTTCNISSIAIDQTALNFTSCDTTVVDAGFFNIIASVTDTGGDPCVGIQVSFTVTPTDRPDEDVAINITVIGSATTNSSGQVTAKVTLGGDCSNDCPGNDCNTSNQVIKATGGGITSDPVTIDTNVP
jgi:hypothetical protein